MKTIITPCVSAEDLSAIRQVARSGDSEVVAVALDLVGGAALRELHDQAIAAGAARCHVLDVREEFARDFLLPALHANRIAGDGHDVVPALAAECVARKLNAIAALEGGADVLLSVSSAGLLSTTNTATGAVLDQAAKVEIAFENGIPHSVNGIAMSMTEVLESLSTIAAAHGIVNARAALHILQSAQETIGASGAQATGSARLELFQGRISARQPEYAAT